jgi:hypothetical protein
MSTVSSLIVFSKTRQENCTSLSGIHQALPLGSLKLLFGIRRTSRLTKTTTPDEFLKQAHKVSLAVTLFEEKKITTICGTSTESCCRILPVSTLEKFGADKDKTVLGRAEALTGLVSHHSGEIVEVDAARSC